LIVQPIVYISIISIQGLVIANQIKLAAYGTFQPVADPPIYGCCQGNSCHWMLVRLLCAQELPLWTPGIFGSN